MNEAWELLRQHRPLLLACESIGWFHMAGKAKADFLRKYGGQPNDYEYKEWYNFENPPFPWSELLQWVKDKFPSIPRRSSNSPWPNSLADFVRRHTEQDPGLLGLLQASHGMASGIEKNLPIKTSEYLGQDITHMWLTTAFGYPARNLLADPPEVLTAKGWSRLVDEIQRLLEELRELGKSGVEDVSAWHQWRQSAVGEGSLLRRAFASTLAETRVPNNDVTLWDQSYVAAALFKSAVAGAVLEGSSFLWTDEQIKQKIRWRLLVVGIGTDHYETRAVKVGDWKGSQAAIRYFFEGIRQLVEVDLAVGSLLYRDTEVAVFSFPGEREQSNVNLPIAQLQNGLGERIDELARRIRLETPPYYQISEASRSLILLTREGQEARDTLAVPLHRPWSIPHPEGAAEQSGHVCPVCRVRLNGDATAKQRPCRVCYERRRGRLDAWLEGQLDNETIWISEVADSNDRLALLTFSLDIEPWLRGDRVDSLRSQSVAEWRRHNPVLTEYWERYMERRKAVDNPVIYNQAHSSMLQYVQEVLINSQRNGYRLNKANLVLANIQDGYRHHSNWSTFFQKVVEDRAEAPSWDDLNEDERARWLVHQLFRKLASPGRVHRFWRQTEEFFADRLQEFREIAFRHPSRRRVRRLVLVPARNAHSWEDRETYSARWRGAPLELLYRADSGAFLTICNLARLLRPEEADDAICGKSLTLTDDEGHETVLTVKEVKEVREGLGAYTPVITLEISPLRFRILVPLEAASECVDRAIRRWENEFGRVWDRLPLRVGVVAFPRMLPFQAVMEALRFMETELEDGSRSQQTWSVAETQAQNGLVALRLVRQDGEQELRCVPVRLPDGREDVFYPYAAVEDTQVRFPRDFQHPDGHVYRHYGDLRTGDGIHVYPARIATFFLESAGARFEPFEVRYLADWEQMRGIWKFVQRKAPSITALHRAWTQMHAARSEWRGPDGKWLPDAEMAWVHLVRAILANNWGVSGAALETLVDAARKGVLEWAIDWHLRVLKEDQRGGGS